MEETTVVEEGTTETDFIDESFNLDVSNLSDEELDAALGSEQEDSSEEEAQATESQPEQKELQVPTPAEEETPPAEEAPPQAPRPDLVNKTREELLAMVSQQEAFISKRSGEIGQLRKREQELLQQLNARAEEIADTDPRTAARLDRAAEDAKRKLEELSREEDELLDLQDSSKLVAAKVDPEHLDAEAIRHELETVDKLPPQVVERILKDPLRQMKAETFIFMTRSAHYKKNLLTVVPIAQALAKEVERLRGELSTAGSKVVSKVEKALKSSPTVSAKSGNSSPGKTIEADPTKLSEAELDEYLKNATE